MILMFPDSSLSVQDSLEDHPQAEGTFLSIAKYMKMMKAATYIMKRDCVFVGTNWDAFLPMERDCPIVIPGGHYACVARHHS